MGEAVLTILIFAGVIAVTALVFSGWILVLFTKGMFRGIGAIFRSLTGSPPRQVAFSGSTMICLNNRCQARNPIEAGFCRRCGQALKRVPVRARQVAAL